MNLPELHRIISQYFDDEELQTICFSLHVDYDDLSGKNKSGKARELVELCERVDRLPQLVEIIREERPSISLDSVLNTNVKFKSTIGEQRERSAEIRGIIIGSVITGIFAILASIATPIVDAVLNPDPTTPTALPTTLPSPTATPSTFEEATLAQYLYALESKDFHLAAELISEYSRTSFCNNKSRDDFELDYKSVVARGTNILNYNIIGSKVLEEDQTVLFRVTLQKQEFNSEPQTNEEIYILRKDDDGVWRVNECDLIDYRLINSEPITDATSGVEVLPVAVVRTENFTLVRFTIASPSGHIAFGLPNQAVCSFNGILIAGQNAKEAGRLTYRFDGLQEEYPTSCQLPELGSDNGPEWIPPIIELPYVQ